MKNIRFVLNVINNTVLAEESHLGGKSGAEFALDTWMDAIQPLADRLKRTEKALNPAELEQLGELLFTALFNGDVLDMFKNLAAAVSETQDMLLRIELCFVEDKPLLAALPWEFLCVPPGQRNGILEPFLAICSQIALVRGIYKKDAALQQVGAGEKLRIGLASSKPTMFLPPLPDYGEINDTTLPNKLTELTANTSAYFKLDNSPALRFTATRNNLRTFLENKKPHILHYIGHGDVLPGGPALILIGDVELGLADAVGASDFCDLFKAYKPAVLVLQSCNTASTGQAAFTSLAAQLAAIGIPVVLAMQYEIQNGVASEFAGRFYDALMTGKTLEAAVIAARQFLYDREDGVDRSFGTPVVYVTTSKSQLFRRSFAEASRDILAEQLLALPELNALEPAEISAVYELCFRKESDITRAGPLRGQKADLKIWLNSLVEASPIKKNPLPLAYFAANLADRIQVSHPALWSELQDWLLRNAAELKVDPNSIKALVKDDSAVTDPPCLQLIIEPVLSNQPNALPADKEYWITARDPRKKEEMVKPLINGVPHGKIKSGNLENIVRK